MFSINKTIILSAWLLLLIPLHVKAYDESFTHGALARFGYQSWQEQNNVTPIAQADGWLVTGASNEDKPAYRCFNHFFDPSTGEGLSILGLKPGVSALEWLELDSHQNLAWGGDYSWPRGLTEAKAGKDQSAWVSLGHSLHLLSDLASPAHVHNDSHPEGDNYELWVKALMSGQSDLNWALSGQALPLCESANSCLRSLAGLTYERALSKDWVNLTALPDQAELLSDGRVMLHGRLLAKYDHLTGMIILDSEVHQAYWSDLAPKVLAYENALISIFWREAGRDFEQKKLSEPSSEFKSAEEIINKIIEAPIVRNIVKPQPTGPSWSEIIANPENWFWPMVDESQGVPVEYLSRAIYQPVWASSGSSAPVTTPSDESGDNSDPVDTDSDSDVDLDIDGDEDSDTGTDTDTDQGGGSGSGGNDEENDDGSEDPVPVQINLLDTPETYFNNLTVAWEPSVAGVWVYDLDYQLDQGPWQNTLSSSSVQTWQYSADTFHDSLSLRVSGFNDKGLSTSTQKTIYFRPAWPDQLLAYWPFDDCSGEYIIEPIGANRLNQWAGWTQGRFGCALSQDGLDSQALGRWLKQPFNTAELTISFWWRNPEGQEAGLNSNGIVLADKDQFWLAGLRPGVQNSTYWTAGEEIILDYQMPSDHQWHHLASSFGSSGMKLYLDGQMVLERPGDASLLTPIAKFYLRGNASRAEFDDLAWWQGILSDTEIGRLAGGGRVWK